MPRFVKPYQSIEDIEDDLWNIFEALTNDNIHRNAELWGIKGNTEMKSILWDVGQMMASIKDIINRAKRGGKVTHDEEPHIDEDGGIDGDTNLLGVDIYNGTGKWEG